MSPARRCRRGGAGRFVRRVTFIPANLPLPLGRLRSFRMRRQNVRHPEEMKDKRDHRRPLVVRRKRIDDLRHFGDVARRDAAQLGMLADRVLAIGQVDAIGLVAGHIAVLPLDPHPDFVKRLVGGPRGPAKLGQGRARKK